MHDVTHAVFPALHATVPSVGVAGHWKHPEPQRRYGLSHVKSQLAPPHAREAWFGSDAEHTLHVVPPPTGHVATLVFTQLEPQSFLVPEGQRVLHVPASQ